jgi:signal transduction histidine kinase
VPSYAWGVHRFPAWVQRVWSVFGWILDAGLALGTAVISVASVLSAPHEHQGGPKAAVVLFALIESLPLAARRRWPLETFALVVAGSAGVDLLTGDFVPLALGIALYTIAAHAPRPAALRAVGAAAVLAVILIIHDGSYNFGVVVSVAVLAVAWVVGDNMRTKRAYLRALEERAVRLERERQEHALRAAAEEQARIARELHDVIAHSVSVMVVQAAAADDVFDTHPDRSREALRAIESTGRSALSELRRLLGVVRTPAERGTYEPQPGLEELDTLVAQVRSAGLPVELVVEGTRDAVPVGIDLSAYRIVQEALTNTLKHAHATRADVVVRYAGSELVVEVVDDGSAAPEGGGNGGHGLIGMRERVALYGGELDAGRRDQGGFGVRARFPLDAEEAP